MNQRDEFAKAALTGLLASGIDTSELGYEEIAQTAYEYADAMIEASKKAEQ